MSMCEQNNYYYNVFMYTVRFRFLRRIASRMRCGASAHGNVRNVRCIAVPAHVGLHYVCVLGLVVDDVGRIPRSLLSTQNGNGKLNVVRTVPRCKLFVRQSTTIL